jgi:hypothetical protein
MGVPMDQVMKMITHNPMQLLDVDADATPSAADVAWARGLVEDPCAAAPPALSSDLPAPEPSPAGGPG